MSSSDPSARHPVEGLRTSAFFVGVAASRKLNYIYVQNWKCGSSTVRSTLWAAEHELGLAAPAGNPHKPSPLAPFISDPRRWEHIDNHFVFTVVRNPYVRVLSAYLDKVHGHRDQKVWSRFAAQHGLGDGTLEFIDFLRIVAATPDDQMDPHWRPQSCNLVPKVVPYNFIGSLENFDADLAHILGRIFPDRTVPIRDHKPHRTGSAEKLARYYGPEELRLARAIYERDFDELGYDLDIASPSRRTPTPRPDSRIIKAWGRACRLMSERDFAAAEREFMDLRPWISGVAVEEQLLHCRCVLKGSDRVAIKENVASLEQALARGQEEWSVWKWYGHGLVRIGRWEDGLQAMLSATERQPRGHHRIKRTRRLVWRLALLRASKGHLQEALATLSNSPVRTDAASSSPAFDRFRRLTLRVVATVAVMIGAPKWHPDRVMGIPHANQAARPSGAAASG